MSRSAQFCWCGHPPRLPGSPGAASPETAWVRARVGQFEIANPKTAQDCETRPVLMLVGSLGPDCDGGAAGIQRFSRNINRLGYDPEKRERDPTIRDYASSETPPNHSMATARHAAPIAPTASCRPRARCNEKSPSRSHRRASLAVLRWSPINQRHAREPDFWEGCPDRHCSV